MTLQQLRLVIEAAKTGSISAAAKRYSVSQPNASMSIKKLEEELGYPLFYRNGLSISPTEQCYLFLDHAQALLEEDEMIRSIRNAESISRLRVGVMNIGLGTDAFLRFCREKRETISKDCLCINVSPETGVKLLQERKLDVVVSVQLKEMLPVTETLCRKNRFTLKKHVMLPTCVRVRKEHPLVQNGTLDGSLGGFQALSAYPYAEYLHLENITEAFMQNSTVGFGYSYKIYVDERETRLRILQETNAYAMGCQLSKKRMEQFDLVSFPLKEEAVLVSMIRKGDEQLDDITAFERILREEAESIKDSW